MHCERQEWSQHWGKRVVDENDIRSSHILFLLLELHDLAFNAVLDDKSLDDDWPMLTLKENQKNWMLVFRRVSPCLKA